MKERGILFSAPMVRALLGGTKTQTRRALRPMPSAPLPHGGWTYHYDAYGGWSGLRREIHGGIESCPLPRCPYGVPGDRLWVRETWRYPGSVWNNGRPNEIDVRVAYEADGAERVITRPHVPGSVGGDGLPRQRCRTDCDRDPGGKHGDELTAYWRRRWPAIHMPRWASRITLEVTEVRVQRLQEISEEDARAEGVDPFGDAGPIGYRDQFLRVWNGINGVDSWDENPWVWAISFKRVTP